ncbi:F-box only protein 33-like [Amphiura filiformis]|uniref:F-box only protein 33-like n=1 Tax=Amphiura filiformis TaxID=82378 RepID=UPI003B210EE4
MSCQRRKRKHEEDQNNGNISAASSRCHKDEVASGTGDHHASDTVTSSKLNNTDENANDKSTDTHSHDSIKSVKRKCSRDLDSEPDSDTNFNDQSLKEDEDNKHWNHLPHAVLIQVYAYLDPIERRQASLTCKQWRECYFYPNLWRDVQLCSSESCWLENNESWKGAEVAIERCGKYVQNLSIYPFTLPHLKEYISGTPIPKLIGNYSDDEDLRYYYRSMHNVLSRVPNILQKVSDHCKDLETLEFKIPEITVYIVPDAISFINQFQESQRLLTEKRMWEQIAGLLKKSPSMQHLKLGYIVDIIGNANRLQQVAQVCGKTLKTLHCPVYYVDPDTIHSTSLTGVPNLDISSFKQLNQLTDLRLNIQYITDELLGILSSPHHCPVKVIVILVTAVEDMSLTIPDAMTNKAWEAMVSHSPQLQVGMSYHYGFGQLPSNNLERVLQKPAIPLHWLKIASPCSLPDQIFRLLQSNFDHVLHRLELIHAKDDQDIMDIGSMDQNPVVMTTWRCNHLTELIITGFQIASNDIVGIARLGTRLRGNSLKVLGIQGSCILYEKPVDTQEDLTAEIRKCMGEEWQPLDDMESELTLWEIMDSPLVPDNKYGTGPVS